MVDEQGAGKGRATPSRKEAEAARKKQMKTPTSRKDQAKRQRAAREAIRDRQREALKTGDDRYLPGRDRGPARRLARDYVDRRWNVAEFLLIFLVIILILGLAAGSATQSWAAYATSLTYPIIIVAVVVDEMVMVRGLRRELGSRLPPEKSRGTVSYAVLRTMQLRRMRLPKPQLRRGDPLQKKY